VSAKRNQLYLGGLACCHQAASLATEALRVQHPFHPRVIEGIRALVAEAALTADTSCDHSGGNGKHPQAEASRDRSGGNIKQAALVHLSSPVNQQLQQQSLRLSQAS
jgi:hypothetical protein